MRQRPQNFVLDYNSPLARGLVFAGLAGGNCRGSKTYYDSSSRKNHGALTNMSPADDWVWIPELGRWGLDFDGSDDYVKAGSRGHTYTDATSFSFWMRLNAIPDLQGYIIGCQSVGDSGIIQVASYVNAPTDYMQYVWISSQVGLLAATAQVPSVGVLTHYCVTHPGGTSHADATWYKDGVAVAAGGVVQQDMTGTPLTPSGSIVLGGRSFDTARNLNAAQCDTLTYNRALTPPEIQQLADPSNVMLSGLVLPPRRKYYGIVYHPTTARFLFLKQSNKFLSLQKT